MAARKRYSPKTKLGDPNLWRARVQAGVILNRLEKNALGELDTEMTAGQVKSADILLRKVMPDLSESAVKSSGELTVNIVQYGNRPPK